MKYGSIIKAGILFKVPVVDMSVSLFSFFGFVCYGISFLIYTVLISRHDLSFLNPFTVGVSSILIFASAAIFFGEILTVSKIVGLSLILTGVVVINIFK
jgi:drug/metabolite transporter (DMT)-like permease